MKVRRAKKEANGGCVHAFDHAPCTQCGFDLRARVRELDRAARDAIGYLVLGDRAAAENVLRAATNPMDRR